MRKVFLPTAIFAVLLTVFSSCIKSVEDECSTEINLTANTLSPTVGGNLLLSTSESHDMYQWSGPGNFSSQHSSSLTISNIKINESGWYHVVGSTSGCDPVYDSILINVKYRQGTPSCALNNNVVRGSHVPDLNATTVTKTVDPTWKGMSLYASGSFGYPVYLVLFNSWDGGMEPKDGVYTTRNIQAFDQFDDPDKIFIQCQYNGAYFKTKEGQDVYVSHVNGKLRVSFCQLNFAGDIGNGNIFNATFTGQLTQTN